ncbi:MAG TPA: hypothetical protein DHU87_07540 [Ruminococcus sp.]|uniref:hypothetical protein n=1 Tax=Ruminococcus sp. TaxID=41978 RepID=UPI000E979A7B|nr:hypothetical protein [Ruminococcus sp.]HBO20327.1 hypothetical protein [Ruminococcus sp.]HCY66406.1 hypothetical protein [Ruminococcus sp.]
MHIKINEDYNVVVNTAILGYVGETNARPVSVEGMEIDGADRYVLTIDYGDGTVYEVDITGGQWTPTADILRSAQTVSCQICAKKLSGDEYILVKKSRIFRLRIGAAIGDNAVPSPSVAADALDRIDAIGRQAHADMQTAVTAAETATTAAENAEKSATTAGVSADTATQAAERAETAKTSAETSATQAENAMQGAETARTEAVKSQNAAKISAAQASTSAQQTEADKTITAGYAKTAKTCADSTTADRQAVQEMVTQVTADKTTVADHAAKVAEDRTAAETAAQTAQAVADSLPDDYTTAVGKIAENTAEIANVKLTDKELQRRVDALYDIGQGITHKFETDSSTAYAKTIPTGGKLMSVKNIGGRSIVWNQLISQIVEKTSNGIATTKIDSKSLHISGTSSAVCFIPISPVQTGISNHKYLFHSHASDTTALSSGTGFYNDNGGNRWHEYGKGIIFTMDGNGTIAIAFRVNSNITVDFSITPQIYDLTALFGSGNEPVSVEEFEKMFPADYYPYNAGEIISAGTEEVVEQGKNLFDIKKCVKLNSYYGFEIDTNKTLQIDLKDGKTCPTNVSFGIVYVHGNTMANWLITSNGVRETITNSRDMTDSTQIMVACYPGNKETMQSIADAFDIMLVDGIYKSDTMPAYAPFHRNEYPIPETIKALSGYGIEGNVTDYEAKTYTQNNTIDGTAIKALDTPIVTDISTLIPDDFLRNIEVEAGGSITFKNSNDNYHIPVPSEEKYIVKLSEIGGTT